MPTSKLSLDFQGLVTAPGKLQAPPGALQKATNINFVAPGFAEKRRGIQRLSTSMGQAGWKITNSPVLNSNVLVNIGNYAGASDLKVGDGSGAWTTLTTPDSTSFANTPADRMRTTTLKKNTYLTSSRACARYGEQGTLFFAGMPTPLGFSVDTLTAAITQVSTGFLDHQYACAYRVVWVMLDDSGAEIQSAPSGRIVIQNTSGTTGYASSTPCNVNLRIILPYQSDTNTTPITTAWIYRVYRSKQIAITTGQPDDEMKLVYQSKPTSTDISNKYIDITDTTPDGAMDGALYTNSTLGRESGRDLVAGEDVVGLEASNYRPPIAKEVAAWADCVFYGNTRTPQRAELSILAVGTTGNTVKAGDTFKFTLGASSFTITGISGTPGWATNQFKVVNNTTWGIAQSIRDTCVNLCACINILPSAQWLTATYIGNDQYPGSIGRIVFELRCSDTTTPFVVEYNPASSLPKPQFIPAMDSGLTSSCDTLTNNIAVSRTLQGDSVPLVNYFQIGRNDVTILAMVPLRDALFVFTNHGLYWITGSTPSDFSVQEFDLTFRLLGREMVVACEDAIYAWGREGIARITNGGVQFIDLPIRNLVQQAIVGLDAPVGLTLQGQAGFAVSYRVERRILFFFKGGAELTNATGSPADSYGCQYALAYHIATGVWSSYDLGSKSGKCTGVVRYSDETLMASEFNTDPGGVAYLYQEPNTQTSNDYCDIDRGNVKRAITTLLEWTTYTPDPSSICHWRETQVYLNTNEYVPALALPAAVSLKVETEFTDLNGITQSTTWTPATQQSRVPMEPAVGMATRMVLTLTHNTIQDYFNLGGWSLIYSPVSSFNTR